MRWTVTLEQDADGQLVLPLPDELLQRLGLDLGDSLYLVEDPEAKIPVLVSTPPARDRFDAPVEPLTIRPRTGPVVQDGEGSKDE